MLLITLLAGGGIAYLILAHQAALRQGPQPQLTYSNRQPSSAPTSGLDSLYANESDTSGSLIAGESGGGGRTALQGVGLGGSGAAAGVGLFASAGTAATAIPIIGIGVAAVTLGLSAIFKHHADAVKKEGQTMLTAVPRFYLLVQQTIKAYNNGETTRRETIQYLDKAMALYYQEVGSIMKGKVNPGGQATNKTRPEPCNGPCTVAYVWLEPYIHQLKAILVNFNFGGKFSSGPIPPHAGFAGIGKTTVIIDTEEQVRESPAQRAARWKENWSLWANRAQYGV